MGSAPDGLDERREEAAASCSRELADQVAELAPLDAQRSPPARLSRPSRPARERREPDDRIPVLYLAPWVDYGGSDKGTIDWFRWLDRDRFAPSLITTQPSRQPPARARSRRTPTRSGRCRT